MSQRSGKKPVSEGEGLAPEEELRRAVRERNHGENGKKHLHLTNSIHIERHLHLNLQSRGGLMLDARRASSLQLPLMREVTALQKIRTLQDPGTSSSGSSGGSSAGGSRKVKSKTFLGDPHRDAQALAVELSGKLAKSAKVPSVSDGGSSRVTSQRLNRGEKNIRVDKQPKRGQSKKMTAEEALHQCNGGNFDIVIEPKVDVRERIKRIEKAFDGSTTGTLSGELRKEGLIKELKRGRMQKSAEKEVDGIPRSDERWDVGPARREELARRVIDERGSSISSLSQLLGNHYGSGRSALYVQGLVDDEERRSNLDGESLFETDEDELSPMEREMTRPRSATMNPASPLHLGSLSRGKEELKKPKPGIRHGRKKPVRARSKDRSGNLTRPRSSKTLMGFKGGLPPSSSIPMDDELDVSELPPQNGCGVPWDWSRIHKYGGKAFLDLTGLACTHPESGKRHGLESLMAEQNLPVQSISSLDSDANALPLIIGEDAHDSDLAGYYIETGRREIPQKQRNRKVSLQNAVKDVPVAEPASTSRSKEEVPPEGHRTLTQKYRPKNFKEIVGQTVVVKSLSIAILKSKVAPVYLFIGPRGTGKTSAARVFAAGLNCESLDYGRRPCGICRECGTMALNRSADVRQVDAASNADLASMRATMGSFTPHARYKVIIVEGCDLLSTDIWNAFLKVLEEPPRNVVFILITTDAEHIPPTATSRCQRFHFSKVKVSDIVRRLDLLAGKEGLHVEAGALELIASRADGSLRDAEIVLDQLCLLDKNVSIALVRELVGLLPDNKILDVLDYALSADTVNTVKTMREVLASGVEPLALVSQLGGLITDILVGSVDIQRDTRREGSFFTRNFSVKEEQHRLRQALKILSEAEKQLRMASDKATWLTAALLQFAPDRSFLPSEANTSVAPSPLVAPPSAGLDANFSASRSEHPSMNEPEYQAQVPEHTTSLGRTLQTYVENKKRSSPEEVQEAENTTLSEQKLEEAWATEPQQPLSEEEHVGETSEPLARALETTLEFRVFRDEVLVELWKRVIWEITSRNLKRLLQKHGRLVAAGVAIDDSCAVVELQFDYARDKHKAERSWRNICIAFQAVLGTAVELRIALSNIALDDGELAHPDETMGDMPPGASTQHPEHHKNTEIVAEDSNAEPYLPSTQHHQHKNKEIIDENAYAYDDFVRETQGVPSQSRRRRGTKPRKHRQASSSGREPDLQPQQSPEPGGITPRRLQPSRRRRPKQAGAANANSNPRPTKTVIPVREIRMPSQDSSSFGSFGGEISVEKPSRDSRVSRDKILLSSMMEEPQSEIEDLHSAQRKILKQRSAQFRNDSSFSANFDRRPSIVDRQRGLPREIRLCWHKASPQPDFLMRKSRVKSLRHARRKALFLRMVPCAEYIVTRNVSPVESTAR